MRISGLKMFGRMSGRLVTVLIINKSRPPLMLSSHNVMKNGIVISSAITPALGNKKMAVFGLM